MSTEERVICQCADCGQYATTHIAIPSAIVGDMVMPYSEDHAQGILADHMVFPGARRVTVLP